MNCVQDKEVPWLQLPSSKSSITSETRRAFFRGCAGHRKPLAETSLCRRSRRHAFGWFEHLQRTFTSFITRKSNLLMTDALDSLGACPIAPEAAVSEADSERPAFPRRTRFSRSVPSERDLESREASESGSPERTYRPHVHRIYDDLAPLRSL